MLMYLIMLYLVSKAFSIHLVRTSQTTRVKSGNLGQQVDSDINLQALKIQIRRLIRIFDVCLVKSFVIPIIKT